jgi:type IV pilus assembly protein PilW
MKTAQRLHSRPSAQAGFSLIELMVSVVVGMAIIAALALLFANSSRARLETEKTSQQIENGRYANQYLRDELRLAGYFGEFSPTALATPLAMPDPSATDDAAVAAAMPLAVQGYHFGVSSTTALPAGVVSLLTDRRASSDVLVVRRISTCVAGPTTAEASCSNMDTSNYKYFQTSLCQTQLTNLPATSQYVLGTDNSVFTTTNPLVTSTPTYLAQKDCTTPAVTRMYQLRIYYVANNDVAGDGIPTLKMVQLGSTAFAAPVAIAEGIETMQVEYGVDTTGDGTPDNYVADVGVTPADWLKVTAVKLRLLARNTQPTRGMTADPRTYIMGSTAATDNTFGPYSDEYKRHLYTTVVRLVNVAERLE